MEGLNKVQDLQIENREQESEGIESIFWREGNNRK